MKKLTDDPTDLELLIATGKEIREITGKAPIDLLTRGNKPDSVLLTEARARLQQLKAGAPTNPHLMPETLAELEAMPMPGTANRTAPAAGLCAQYERLMSENRNLEAAEFYEVHEAAMFAEAAATKPSPQPGAPTADELTRARNLLAQSQAFAPNDGAGRIAFLDQNETALNAALDLVSRYGN